MGKAEDLQIWKNAISDASDNELYQAMATLEARARDVKADNDALQHIDAEKQAAREMEQELRRQRDLLTNSEITKGLGGDGAEHYGLDSVGWDPLRENNDE